MGPTLRLVTCPHPVTARTPLTSPLTDSASVPRRIFRLRNGDWYQWGWYNFIAVSLFLVIGLGAGFCSTAGDYDLTA